MSRLLFPRLSVKDMTLRFPPCPPMDVPRESKRGPALAHWALLFIHHLIPAYLPIWLHAAFAPNTILCSCRCRRRPEGMARIRDARSRRPPFPPTCTVDGARRKTAASPAERQPEMPAKHVVIPVLIPSHPCEPRGYCKEWHWRWGKPPAPDPSRGMPLTREQAVALWRVSLAYRPPGWMKDGRQVSPRRKWHDSGYPSALLSRTFLDASHAPSGAFSPGA